MRELLLFLGSIKRDHHEFFKLFRFVHNKLFILMNFHIKAMSKIVENMTNLVLI
ncbi:MAG: hypothetical protein CM15mP31_1090 [Gammaproteobacteria bacterium]|nr:MAG: hypothetical protein CM15mP31_1090 [Gammaproteobacteria bacterium]